MACSLAALYGGCPGAKVCGHETLHIENDHGDHFEVRHDRSRSTVVGKDVLSWSGRLGRFVDLGVCRFRVDFTVRDYDLPAMQHIMEHVIDDRVLPGTHAENLERVLL